MSPHINTIDISPQKSVALCQNRLNISNRSRSSRLPWRGQFSPELVEYLLDLSRSEISSVYDPFCGSGTVLYESLHFGFKAFGLEINPAAWHLSVLSRYSKLSADERLLVKFEINSFATFASNALDKVEDLKIQSIISNVLHNFSKLAISAIYILALGNKNYYSNISLKRAVTTVLELLNEIDQTQSVADCYLGDARNSPIADSSIDLVVTSPPYINVFNYHQNYRPAVENLGWNPLKAAPAEIGANRKNRSNRFLTVTQYCLDLHKTLADISRVLKPEARLIMVLGKTSNVLGTSFENGEIIRRLLSDIGGFKIESQQSRSFINRFGEEIEEDLFFAIKTKGNFNTNYSPLEIALDLLRVGKKSVSEKNKYLLEEAIEKSETVSPSPEVHFTIPNHLQHI